MGSVEEAVHHVDTILGLLVTIMVFLANITASRPDIQPIASQLQATRLAIVIVVSIAFWVIGVLLQNWIAKSVAWFTTAFAFFALVEMVLLGYFILLYPTSLSSLFPLSPFFQRLFVFALMLVPLVLSVLFCWYVVRRAYQQRLSAAGAMNERKKMEDVMRVSCWLFGIGMLLVLVGMLVGLNPFL